MLTAFTRRMMVKRAKAHEAFTHVRTHWQRAQRRTTVRHEHRSARRSWAFRHLRQRITDNAAQTGAPIRLVDPWNTSRTCSACGHCE
jgi:IS605 OrfB family transposase